MIHDDVVVQAGLFGNFSGAKRLTVQHRQNLGARRKPVADVSDVSQLGVGMPSFLDRMPPTRLRRCLD